MYRVLSSALVFVVFFRARSDVSGSLPPKFEPMFAGVYEVRPSDCLPFSLLAKLV